MGPLMSRSMIAALVAGSCVALGSTAARADGAFPDSQGLLLPTDRPNEIMLATTFGVVMTIDDGQTWTYSCEMLTNGALAAFYNIGPAPLDRVFAKTDIALIYTDDHACTWNRAGGMLAGKPPADYFPDAANANRVWAARTPDTGTGPYTIVESMDGGATFGTVRFTAAVGDGITGVELAKSDANTAYVTLRSGSNFAPKLAMTKDGGATWMTRDLSTVAAIGSGNASLVSIDPTMPSKIFLRINIPSGATKGDGIALSLDGGATFVSPPPVSVPGGVLSSFTRLSSGTLLAAGVDGVRNVIFRSTNGGMTFTELDGPLVRGLGQRNGIAYAASSEDLSDPTTFALARSTDDGVTFQPILHFADVQAISSCVKAICADDCNLKVNMGIWSEDVCTADATPGDGGTPHPDSGTHDGSAGAGGTGGAATDGGEPPVKGTGLFGCNCVAAGAAGTTLDGASAIGAALFVLLLLSRGPARRRRYFLAWSGWSGLFGSSRSARRRSPTDFS